MSAATCLSPALADKPGRLPRIMPRRPRPSITERAIAYVSKMDGSVAGQRGHDTAFSAACALVQGFCLSPDTALGIFADHFNPRCSPPWSAAEMRHKINSAAGSASRRGVGYLLDDDEDEAPAYASARTAPMPPAWPPPDAARIADIAKAGPSALELWERSPHPIPLLSNLEAAEVLPALLGAGDPLLCIGKSMREFATRPLSWWLNAGRLAEMSLIVPSPMTSRTGTTKDGRESEHTLENTGPRRNVVVEFDKGAANEHAAIIHHLAGFAPLALVVHSGGKSLHAWFPVGDATEDEVKRFQRYAASLGADAVLFRNPSQFVRIPGGRRQTGERQDVVYFDPATIRDEGGQA